ncbi:hypothetical protein FJZ22_02630 [Candidatus Pacearchaeota archaeon]|nr:hypothetical protein [Candidatus Pacearchaeota archaeon]
MFSEIYLLPDTKEQLCLAWQSEGYVQIDHLLSVDEYIRLAKSAWGKGKQVERADCYSYELVTAPALHKAFGEELMKHWLGSILGGKIRTIKLSLRHFGKGDYTLLHDAQKSEGVARFFFIFSGTWDASWGGTLHVRREKAQTLEVGIKGNRFFLVRSREEWRSFIQYVNHLAGKETFVIVEGTVS